jgi:hypothetical protein
MPERGKEKFGEKFHLSHKKLMQLEPFNMYKAGEKTCV